MLNSVDADAAIVLIRGETARFLNTQSLVAEGEKFYICGEEILDSWPEFDWIGFYDWLRNSSGKIIGVRLRIDDLSSLGNIFFERVAAFLQGETLLVLFYENEKICEIMSDDADFGGNCVFIGKDDMIAISFNGPRK